jgi:hypothetical protein
MWNRITQSHYQQNGSRLGVRDSSDWCDQYRIYLEQIGYHRIKWAEMINKIERITQDQQERNMIRQDQEEKHT